MCLKKWRFQPECAYKIGAYKKKGVVVNLKLNDYFIFSQEPIVSYLKHVIVLRFEVSEVKSSLLESHR